MYKKGLTPLDKTKNSGRNYLTGLTLMEIIVSTMLIALTLFGLTNLFVAGKSYILHSRTRMTAGEFGRIFLDPLQMQVRQDTWDQATNDLSTGTRYCDSDPLHTPRTNSCLPEDERKLHNIVYNAQYDIDDVTTNVRRVKLTVSWQEFQP